MKADRFASFPKPVYALGSVFYAGFAGLFAATGDSTMMLFCAFFWACGLYWLLEALQEQSHAA